MKLEIKHLAPYLPYGIPAKLSQKGIFNLDEEYPSGMAMKKGMIKNISFWHPEITGQLHITETYSFDFDELDEVDIILRPLSDLSKEISINGNTFLPIEFLIINFNKTICPYMTFSGNLELDIQTEDYSQTIDLFDGYLIVQKLLEWHFDVFGLIEKGLAIDINTLNQ